MKKKFKKEYILKGAGVLLVVSVLLFSNLSVMANNIDIKTQNSLTAEKLINRFSGSPLLFIGEEIFFEEDMEDKNIPPITPPWGEWKNTTISDQTWFIDHSDPEEGDVCATVRRGEYDLPQNEWLITPSLDFSKYNEIRLLFCWYTSDYAARDLDIIDLNVSITIDKEENWVWLWNEDNEQPFWSWEWQDCEIDLSTYAGESDVRIGFQFNSSNNNLKEIQEFSIDSVQIIGDSISDFWCGCGDNETISWPYNKIEGIQFIGNAGGGISPYKNWSWDFGDGEKARIKDPKHSYQHCGKFNVTLEVRDSADPPHIAFSYKTIEVVETPPSEIALKIKSPSIGIKVEIENTGVLNITQIFWDMRIEWGVLRKHNQIVDEGNISFLEGGGKTTIRSPLFFPGFGLIRIIVTADPLNSYRTDIIQNAIKIGPLIMKF